MSGSAALASRLRTLFDRENLPAPYEMRLIGWTGFAHWGQNV